MRKCSRLSIVFLVIFLTSLLLSMESLEDSNKEVRKHKWVPYLPSYQRPYVSLNTICFIILWSIFTCCLLSLKHSPSISSVNSHHILQYPRSYDSYSTQLAMIPKCTLFILDTIELNIFLYNILSTLPSLHICLFPTLDYFLFFLKFRDHILFYTNWPMACLTIEGNPCLFYKLPFYSFFETAKKIAKNFFHWVISCILFSMFVSLHYLKIALCCLNRRQK